MGGLFKTPSIPKPEPVKPMPQANQAEVQKTARRRTQQMSRRAGQQSTLLSTGGRETLGA